MRAVRRRAGRDLLVAGVRRHLPQRPRPQALLQVIREDLLDRVPVDPQQLGHMLDGTESAEVDDIATEVPHVTPLAIGKADGLAGKGCLKGQEKLVRIFQCLECRCRRRSGTSRIRRVRSRRLRIFLHLIVKIQT